VWQAHVDASDQSPQAGFNLTFCYIPANSSFALNDCTVLVENSYDHSGVTAPITAIGNYPKLDTPIGFGSEKNTWSLDIEELSS